MGWDNYHLYRFTIDGIRFGEPDEEYEPEIKHARRTKLRNVIDTENQKIFYTYDYGDGWEMTVSLEKILPKIKNRSYPICVDGKLAAPPEDCGGTPGYYQCIKAFEAADELEKLPDTEEREELQERLDWLSGWNPDMFDPKGIQFEKPRNRFLMALDLE